MAKKDNYRQQFHIMPPQGWLNDPNGLCQKDGLYHTFFQYTPDNPEGGNKSWGHYESGDLLHWDFTGEVIKPDTIWDKDGAYSGSAFIEDGKIHLYYTGNVKEEGDFDYIYQGRQANILYTCTEDGREIGPKECIMTSDDYPDDMSCHVRDPKIWKENETYYMVLGARSKEDVGLILLYQSRDGKQWKLENRIEPAKALGYMWECPDYLQFENKNFLCFSPQGVRHKKWKYQNQYSAGYTRVGGSIHGDYELGTYYEWDKGFDFYAPQTFVDESGRVILLGWMGMPDASYTNPTVKDGWQHCMTIPRELVAFKDRIFQKPVEELKKLRKEELYMPEKGRMENLGNFELVVNGPTGIRLLDDFEFGWNRETKEASIRFLNDSGSGREIRRGLVDEIKEIRMFVDSSSVEIFINGGEVVFTTRYYRSEKEVSLQLMGNVTARLYTF